MKRPLAAIVTLAILAACSASPPGATSAGIALAPAWDQPSDRIASRLLLGHNTIWSRGGLGLWDEASHAPSAAVLPIVRALSPGLLRFPGGTRAMRYHFAQAIGPLAARVPQCDPFTGATDATSYGLDELLAVAASLGSDVSLVAPWVDGSPQETAALVAYVNGDASSPFAIGADAEGHDWGTAGDWAKKRAANGHAAPYGVKVIEIGNEPYLDLPAGPPVSCGRPSRFRQDERWVNGAAIPTTARDYAAELRKTRALVRAVDPAILVGAPAAATYDGSSDAAQALGDVDAAKGTGDPWNARLVADAGDAFDLFVLHPYDFGTSNTRLTLAERTRKAIRDLRALSPGRAIAITEFGFLTQGDTMLNALVTADMLRVAIEEGVLLVARHVLIEDVLTEPFASAAAIGGPDHRTTPAYAVEQALAAIVPGARPVAVDPPVTDVVLLALLEADGSLAVAAIDRRAEPGAGIDLAIALPPGAWSGEVQKMSPSALDDTSAAFVATRASAAGTLALHLPASGIAVARLAR